MPINKKKVAAILPKGKRGGSIFNQAEEDSRRCGILLQLVSREAILTITLPDPIFTILQ